MIRIMPNVAGSFLSARRLRKPSRMHAAIAVTLGTMALVLSAPVIAQSGGWWLGIAQMKLVKDAKASGGRSVTFHAMENERTIYSVVATEYRDPKGRLMIRYAITGRSMRFPNSNLLACPDMRAALSDLAAYFRRRPAGADVPCQYDHHAAGMAVLKGEFPVVGSGVKPARSKAASADAR